MNEKANLGGGELAPFRKKQALPPPNLKNMKNTNLLLVHVLGLVRSHFGARASNRKANRRSNRMSLAVAAVGRLFGPMGGGKRSLFWEKNHLFKILVDLRR